MSPADLRVLGALRVVYGGTVSDADLVEAVRVGLVAYDTWYVVRLSPGGRWRVRPRWGIGRGGLTPDARAVRRHIRGAG